MRIRSIKPSFWRSDDITSLPMDVRLLYIGLWSYVDDNGVGIDDYRQIAADLFALEEDQTAIRSFVRDGLATLSRGCIEASRGFLVIRYRVEGSSYLFIPTWDLHQKVDRPTKPRYPRPPEYPDPPTSQDGHDREGLAIPREDASRARSARAFIGEGEKGRRGEGEHKKTSSSCGPRSARGTRIPDDFTVTDKMVAWASEHAPHVDGRFETAQFIDYWQAKAGKDATKLDWVRTWQTWLRRAEKESTRRSQQNRPSTTDQRVQAGLDLAAELRAEAEQRAIAALAPANPAELRIVGGQP